LFSSGTSVSRLTSGVVQKRNYLFVIALVLEEEKRKRRKRKHRRYWIHSICSKRNVYGEFHSLFGDGPG
jgi:hypothetical protein